MSKRKINTSMSITTVIMDPLKAELKSPRVLMESINHRFENHMVFFCSSVAASLVRLTRLRLGMISKHS